MKILSTENKSNPWINNIYLIFILFLPLSWASTSVGSIYRMVSIGVIVLFVAKHGSKIQIRNEKFPLFTFWTLFVFHTMVTYIYKTQAANTLVYGGMILLYLISLVFVNSSISDIKHLDICFFIAGLFFILSFLFGDRIVLNQRESVTIFGTRTDMNEFSSFFIILIPLCFTYLLRKSALRRIGLVAMIIASGYILLMAASRGALIALAATILLQLWLEKRTSLRNLIWLTITVVIVTFVFSRYLIDLIPESNLSRLTIDALTSDNGSGRSTIWRVGWQSFTNGPMWRRFLGYGPYGIAQGYTLHNSFLEVLVDYGYIGIFYYICMIICAYKQYLKMSKTYAAIFAGIIAVSLTLSLGPSYKILWILIFIAMLEPNGCETSCEESWLGAGGQENEQGEIFNNN